MLGEADPDAIIADRLSGDSPFMATDKMDLNEGVTFDEPVDAAVPASTAGPIEIDLTDALAGGADDKPSKAGKGRKARRGRAEPAMRRARRRTTASPPSSCASA